MRKIKNFIGNTLIALAAFISFLRNTLFFILTIGLVMGILVITMIALLELISMVSSSPYTDYQLVVLGKWYWCVIVLVIGGSTMWLGLVKMFEDDKEDKNPDVGKGWGNHNYNYGNKKI